MTFRATLLQSGKTATGVEVPPEIVASLGSSKRPAVLVTINGYTYRSTIATISGKFMLPVSAEVRDRAGITAGDDLDVSLELDTAPREIAIPPDFMEALSQNPAAKSFFDTLSYSNQRRLVLQIEQAKTPETRHRRITKVVSALHNDST